MHITGEFIFWKQLKESLERHGNPIKMLPRLDGKQIDMFTLYRRVVRMGGHKKVTADGKWGEVADDLKVSPRLGTRADLVQVRTFCAGRIRVRLRLICEALEIF